MSQRIAAEAIESSFAAEFAAASAAKAQREEGGYRFEALLKYLGLQNEQHVRMCLALSDPQLSTTVPGGKQSQSPAAKIASLKSATAAKKEQVLRDLAASTKRQKVAHLTDEQAELQMRRHVFRAYCDKLVRTHMCLLRCCIGNGSAEEGAMPSSAA